MNQILTMLMAFVCATLISACSSPPEPPQPSGERVYINSSQSD